MLEWQSGFELPWELSIAVSSEAIPIVVECHSTSNADAIADYEGGGRVERNIEAEPVGLQHWEEFAMVCGIPPNDLRDDVVLGVRRLVDAEWRIRWDGMELVALDFEGPRASSPTRKAG